MPRDFSRVYNLGLKFEGNFPIRIDVIAFLFAGGLSAAYYFLPAQKAGITFFAIAVGAAAAITSAFYVGQSVIANVESSKMSRTMTLTAKWNDASFFHAKKAIIELMKPIVDLPREARLTAIQEKIRDHETLELNITSVLNYLEDMAVLVEKDFVDEGVIRELFQTNVFRYFDTFEPWIADLRNRRGSRLYKGLENLRTKWHTING